MQYIYRLYWEGGYSKQKRKEFTNINRPMDTDSINNKTHSSCFSALMIASIFFAVLSLILSRTSGPFLIIFATSMKQMRNSWFCLMFLHFERLSRTTQSVTDSLNLSLRISCACLITPSSYSKISQNPHFFIKLTKPSSFISAFPKSTTSIFLFLMPLDMKMFHMRWANFQDVLPLQLYLIRMSFLIVTTACFWKLWFRLFLGVEELFDGVLEEIGSDRCWAASLICWREMKVFYSYFSCACFSLTYSQSQKNRKASSYILGRVRKLVFRGIIFYYYIWLSSPRFKYEDENWQLPIRGKYNQDGTSHPNLIWLHRGRSTLEALEIKL